jgi:hypothetical protein
MPPVSPRPYPLYLVAIDAVGEDEARRLVTERWLADEPELRLQIMRADGDRLVRVAPHKK